MSLAIDIENRRLRVSAKPQCSGLVGCSTNRDFTAEILRSREKFGMQIKLVTQAFRVGVIGTDETVAGFSGFLQKTERGIESRNKLQINLNSDFQV